MHYVIIGLGLTGFSVAKYLAANKSYKISIIDSRENPPYLTELTSILPDIKVYTGDLHPKVQQQADYIVLSPGISDSLLIPNLNIINDIELFAKEVSETVPIIAITGSNGKSTVATVTAKVLEAAGLNVGLGGNIGIPVLDLLSREYDVYVLELSSFQLEHIKSLNNHIAVLLNLAADHLDRYDNKQEKYFATKHRIFDRCKHAIFNGADKNIIVPEHNIDFSKIPNRIHPNFKAAIAIIKLLNIKEEIALNGIKNFKGLEHRQEVVLEKNNITWINDSKATNVAATTMALEVFANNIILIAGGSSKNEDLTVLKPIILRACKQAILIGETSEEFYKFLHKNLPCTKKTSLEDAVELAAKIAVSGDIVLFSPACASFDMFANFAERGKIFKNLVKIYASL